MSLHHREFIKSTVATVALNINQVFYLPWKSFNFVWELHMLSERLQQVANISVFLRMYVHIFHLRQMAILEKSPRQNTTHMELFKRPLYKCMLAILINKSDLFQS